MKKQDAMAPQGNPLEWELDSRETRLLFDAAKKDLEQRVERYRAAIIELERFEPLPQVYNRHDNSFAQFDRKTKDDRIASFKKWLESAERVHRFVLKVSDHIMQHEAEAFGEQMNAYFNTRKEGK